MGNSPVGNAKPSRTKPVGNDDSAAIADAAETGADTGTGADAGTVIDPGTIQPVADADQPKRKRGRPRADGSAGTAAAAKPRAIRQKAAHKSAIDVGTITLALGFVSGFISQRFNEPTLKLDDDEAAQIADATANVAQHYDVPVSPITQAWIALGMTVGSIYAGKIAAIKFRRGTEKETVSTPQHMG